MQTKKEKLMPKVKISGGKGLVQESGTGFEVNTVTTLKKNMLVEQSRTISGHHAGVKAVDGNTTLTNLDSGKVIICGGAAGTIQFPVDVAGFNATFFITGSVNGDVVLSGSAASTSTAVTMIATVLSGSTSGGSGILFTTPKDIRFDASGTDGAGDRIDVTVLLADSLIVANGQSQIGR